MSRRRRARHLAWDLEGTDPEGACGTLFTASGNVVRADPSITMVLGLAHAGSCSGNNVGAGISKLSIVCASSNPVTLNC